MAKKRAVFKRKRKRETCSAYKRFLFGHASNRSQSARSKLQASHDAVWNALNNEMYWIGKMKKYCVCTCTIKPIMDKEILQKMNTVIIYSPSCHCKTIGLSFFSEIKQEKLWKIYCALSMQLKWTETSASKSYNYQMIKNKSKTCTVAISSKVIR